MTVGLIAENTLEDGDFSTATEQEGEYIGQPEPGSNSGDFRLLSSGDIEDFSYSGTATSDGAADGTTAIDSVLSIFGDDYFIGGTVTIDEFLQDSGDYTEQDVPGRLALTTANKITMTDLDDDEEIWLYIDEGAAHFSGDFEFQVNINCTANAANGDTCGLWALTNTVDTLNDIDGASSDFLAVYWKESGGSDYIFLEECNDGVLTNDQSSALSKATEYYLKIVRDESVGTYGTLYCYIYDDSAMTSLVDTLTVTLTEKQDFRYWFWMIAYESGIAGCAWDGTIQSLYVVTTEEKDVTDFAQSTGTLTVDAFTYRVNTGTTFTLEVAFSTRDFRVVLDGSGDAGDATFKWSHNGGTTYLGRDDPNQATWIQGPGISISASSNPTHRSITQAEDGTWVTAYENAGAGNNLAITRSSDGGITWEDSNLIEAFGQPVDILTLKSGRILLYHVLPGPSLYLTYSDDNGVTWSDQQELALSPSSSGSTRFIELPNGNILSVIDTSNTVDAYISSDGGFTFSTAIEVANDANDQHDPCVVIAENGDIVCAYTSDEDGGLDEVKCKISSDGGSTWGSVIEVVAQKAAHLDDPDIIKDINGRLYAICDDGTDTYLCYSDDNGVTWSATITLTGSAAAYSSLSLLDGHIIVCTMVSGGGIDMYYRGFWEAYSANGCPCAQGVIEQKLINDVGIVWQGGDGVSADSWSFTPEYDYSMKNLISDSPSKSWRSEQDNIACNLLLDMGANERFFADAVAYFGSNLRTLSFQMNATDAWTSPSIDESISFDLATGTIDSVSGNHIQDTSLLANYKEHELKGCFFRATSGTDSGVTWEIKDNIDDWIVLDTTSAHNLAASDTFAIFQNKIAANFTNTTPYRYIRPVAISAQHTSDDYYEIGSVVMGKIINPTAWKSGWVKSNQYDIELLKTLHGGIVPIVGSGRKRIFRLEWPPNQTAKDEIIALFDYLLGKNVVLIPDTSDMTDIYLCKLVSNIETEYIAQNNFQFSLDLEEIL